MARAKTKRSPPKKLKNNVLVSIVMGSESDRPIMEKAREILYEFRIPCEMEIVSAHRTPREMFAYAEKAHSRGVKVIIAGAGGAAHLPGMIASLTPLPVIGVPVPIGALGGHDALLSIAQMPTGVPVATVAVGNATNAGLLAVQILGAMGNPDFFTKISAYKASLRKKVLGMR